MKNTFDPKSQPGHESRYFCYDPLLGGSVPQPEQPTKPMFPDKRNLREVFKSGTSKKMMPSIKEWSK